MKYLLCFTIFIFLSCSKKEIVIPDTPVIQKGLDELSLPELQMEYENIFSNDSIELSSIASSSYHIGFPDIVKYNNMWFVTFRYSDGHLPKTFSKVIVIKSNNLNSWMLDKGFTQSGFDLRDPNFIINPTENKLHLQFHSTAMVPYGTTRSDYITDYSALKNDWEDSFKIVKDVSNLIWLWRPVWNVSDQNFYVVGYYNDSLLKLFKSSSGNDYKEVYSFHLENEPSEATIRFYDDSAYVLIRMLKGLTLLGKSPASSLKKWEFEELPWTNMGGPNFLKYKDYFIISGRVGNETRISSYNIKTKVIKKIASLPSYDDNGYAGLSLSGDILTIVYYTGSPSGDHKLNIAQLQLNKYKTLNPSSN